MRCDGLVVGLQLNLVVGSSDGNGNSKQTAHRIRNDEHTTGHDNTRWDTITHDNTR